MLRARSCHVLHLCDMIVPWYLSHLVITLVALRLAECSKNYTGPSSLPTFLCTGHPREPRQVFECLFKKLARQGRTLSIPVTPEFLSDTVGLKMLLVNLFSFSRDHCHLPLGDK